MIKPSEVERDLERIDQLQKEGRLRMYQTWVQVRAKTLDHIRIGTRRRYSNGKRRQVTSTPLDSGSTWAARISQIRAIFNIYEGTRMASSITRLSKPITRRVGGDHLVTLNEHTIEIREARSNKSYTVSYAELMLNVSAANRKKAFERPAPKGWVPQPGDEVYVRSKRTPTGTVIGQGEIPTFTVRFDTGVEHDIHPSNLRPA